MTGSRKPKRGEIIDYYFTYVDQIGDGDIVEILRAQEAEAAAAFGAVSEEKSLHRYAPGKWSIRETLGHVNDVERLFAFRAFWFARMPEVALPSFDHDRAATESGADDRPLSDHLAEFRTVRAATCALFAGFNDEAWQRHGVASDNPFSVRGCAYIIAGHLQHHLRLARERYL
jgi:DinB superfamily